MGSVVCNKTFVKYLFSVDKEEASVNYRYYLMAKHHFSKRSGIFSVSEFLDLLHEHYSYSCLHKGVGNSRAKYRRRFLTLFQTSVLFEMLSDGRIKYVPEKKIIGSKQWRYSSRIELAATDVCSARIFTDRIIGIISSGNYLKSYQTMAEETGFTRRRCINAVKQNEKDQKFIKVHNFILTKSSLYLSDINAERRDLLSYHNIYTPQPVKYGGKWYLCLYAPNSYVTVSFNAELTKQTQEELSDLPLVSEDLTPYIHNKRCYYTIVPLKSNLYRRYSNTCFFTFNEQNFSYQEYINNYSHTVGEVRSVA